MRGCGAEGADKHCGKVWLTYAINMAKVKFEAAPSVETSVRTLGRVQSKIASAGPLSNGFGSFYSIDSMRMFSKPAIFIIFIIRNIAINPK